MYKEFILKRRRWVHVCRGKTRSVPVQASKIVIAYNDGDTLFHTNVRSIAWRAFLINRRAEGVEVDQETLATIFKEAHHP